MATKALWQEFLLSDILFEAEIYSFQTMYKPKRKFVSLILSQQEKREKKRGNCNHATSPFCYITGLSGCKIFTWILKSNL